VPFRLTRDRTNIAMLRQRMQDQAQGQASGAAPPQPAAKCE
jgi:hypothetical protein